MTDDIGDLDLIAQAGQASSKKKKYVDIPLYEADINSVSFTHDKEGRVHDVYTKDGSTVTPYFVSAAFEVLYESTGDCGYQSEDPKTKKKGDHEFSVTVMNTPPPNSLLAAYPNVAEQQAKSVEFLKAYYFKLGEYCMKNKEAAPGLKTEALQKANSTLEIAIRNNEVGTDELSRKQLQAKTYRSVLPTLVQTPMKNDPDHDGVIHIKLKTNAFIKIDKDAQSKSKLDRRVKEELEKDPNNTYLKFIVQEFEKPFDDKTNSFPRVFSPLKWYENGRLVKGSILDSKVNSGCIVVVRFQPHVFNFEGKVGLKFLLDSGMTLVKVPRVERGGKPFANPYADVGFLDETVEHEEQKLIEHPDKNAPPKTEPEEEAPAFGGMGGKMIEEAPVDDDGASLHEQQSKEASKKEEAKKRASNVLESAKAAKKLKMTE